MANYRTRTIYYTSPSPSVGPNQPQRAFSRSSSGTWPFKKVNKWKMNNRKIEIYAWLDYATITIFIIVVVLNSRVARATISSSQALQRCWKTINDAGNTLLAQTCSFVDRALAQCKTFVLLLCADSVSTAL